MQIYTIPGTDQDYCGCCGGDADQAPKGEHVDCCNEQHDVKAATASPVAASDRNLIYDARAIAAAAGFDKQRAYLASVASDYAASDDLLLIAAAVLGRAQHDLRELAARLEYEIGHSASLAAELSVARQYSGMQANA